MSVCARVCACACVCERVCACVCVRARVCDGVGEVGSAGTGAFCLDRLLGPWWLLLWAVRPAGEPLGAAAPLVL